MMDISTILTFVFGSTSLVGLVASLIYRKQNRQLKNNEVKASNVETQKAQMDLGEEYLKKVMEISEMNYQQSLKNGKDNADIIAKVDRIYTEQKSIVEYLNGDYQEYLKRKGESIITT